jgi:hypothetical protein
MKTIIRSIVTLVILLVWAVPSFAIDINPGTDRFECPGTMITLGDNPVAGPLSVSEYKIRWYASTGVAVPEGANPEIPAPEVRTTYKVVVEDPNGFICEESVTITPVTFESLAYTPDALPADGSSTAQGSVVVSDPGRAIIWRIEEADGSNAVLNEATGLLTAGTTPGTVKIRVQDKESAANNTNTCYAETSVCVGDPENCCPEVNGEIHFGPITAYIAAPLAPSNSADSEGYCSYNTSGASINIGMAGGMFEAISFPSIKDVSITWRQKNVDGNVKFKDVTITWEGKAETRKFGPLQANLEVISVTVDPNGKVSGAVTFTVNQVYPERLGKIAFLDKGTTGTFTYKYSGSKDGFEGDYDFGGIKNLKLVIRKGIVDLATVYGSLSSDGVFSGKFVKGGAVVKYSSGKFTAELKSFTWDFTFDIKQRDIALKNGFISFVLDNIENTKGKIDVSATLNEKEAWGDATFSNLEAFGFDIQGALRIELNSELDLLGIEGRDISAKHPDFNSPFTIKSFRIVDNKLLNFSFEGTAKYKDKINFNISRAVYVDKIGIDVTAQLKIGNSAEMNVSNFKISSDGIISIAGVNFEINQFPFEPLKGGLTFKQDHSGFAGNFTGIVTGGVGISGAVDVGSQSDWNYAYFKLMAKTKMGVRIGPVIKVEEIGGLAGYNYNYASKAPAYGDYLFGFTLGISDVADMIDIRNDLLLLQIGQSPSLSLNGSIAVPGKGRNRYLEGTLYAKYNFGSNNVEGNVEATINVPANTGNVLNIYSEAAFTRNQAGWSLSSSGEGSLFKQINFSGLININAPANNVEGIRGMASGQILYSKSLSFTTPTGFNGTSCETADATDRFGFGFDGGISLSLGGSFLAEVNPQGFAGKITANAKGESFAKVKWPCGFSACKDCVESLEVDVEGELTLGYNKGKTILEGNMTFSSLDGERETKYVEFEF